MDPKLITHIILKYDLKDKLSKEELELLTKDLQFSNNFLKDTCGAILSTGPNKGKPCNFKATVCPKGAFNFYCNRHKDQWFLYEKSVDED